MNFLTGSDIKRDALKCMRGNLEGKYHRTTEKDALSPYTSLMKVALDEMQAEVNDALNKCLEDGNCSDSLLR